MTYRDKRSVFAYGSLMFLPVWRAVVGRDHPSTTASLRGYRRSQINGASYPAVVPDAESSVFGCVYRGIRPADLRRLDRFEGAEYKRTRCRVETSAGETIEAWVYVWRPALKHVLSTKPWSPNDFARRGLKQFLRDYRGFRKA